MTHYRTELFLIISSQMNGLDQVQEQTSRAAADAELKRLVDAKVSFSKDGYLIYQP